MHKISSNFFPYKLGVHICKKSNLKKRRQINKITNGIMKVFFFVNIYIYIYQQVNNFIKDKRRTSG